MNSLDSRRFEMLTRVRDFGDAHSDLFPQDSKGAQAFVAVTHAVAELAQHTATQVSGRSSAREGTTSKAVARDSLRDDLDAIVLTARAIAVNVPGMDDKFRPPRGGDQQLLITARAFARDAEPLKTSFISHDMPSTFVEDLKVNIAAFEEAMRGQDSGKDTRAAATAAINQAMESGLDAVTVLDAIIHNRLRDDVAVMAVWERARRVEYRTGRKTGETQALPPPLPGAPPAGPTATI